MRPVETLVDWARRVVPGFVLYPHTLEIFEAIAPAIVGEPIRTWLAVPPRLGKTTSVLALASYIMCHSRVNVAYVTCSDELANTKSLELQGMVRRGGFHLEHGRAKISEWVVEETQARFTSAGIFGSWIGKGFDLIIPDDLIKNAKEADSALIRETTWRAFSVDIDSRRDNKSASGIVGIGSRLHEDDPGGRIIRGEFGEPFKVISLPAINEAGEPLCNQRLTLEDLGRIRVRSERDYWSMYMQNPRPRGDTLFREPSRFVLADFLVNKDRPLRTYQWLWALDPAVTASTHADHSAAPLLAMSGSGDKAEMWAVDLLHVQAEIPDVISQLIRMRNMWAEKGARADIGVESVGGFKSVPQMMRVMAPGVTIREIKVASDKFTRAQPLAGAWNDKRVHIPSDAPWADVVIDQFSRFTGLDDPEDDIVDAFAHGFTEMTSKGSWMSLWE